MKIPYVTANQMAEVDTRAIEDYGIEMIQLMENAARSLADFVRRELGDVSKLKIVALTGKGNNGGDAIAATRHLHNAGAEVTVILARAASEINELSQRQVAIVEKSGIPVLVFPSEQKGICTSHVNEADLLIDGLLGYNIQGNPRGAFAELITRVNNSDAPVIACDLPSGLDPDSGLPNKPTIRAAWTLTLALPKTSLKQSEARAWTGELWCADIGIPLKLYKDMGIEVGNIFANQSIIRL